MANRKVLINRHTSTSGAPIASEMFKGEIAVAHKTGEEILWTKNNDNKMVPFISCAQTISIIDGKIAAVDVVYDVNKKEGEPYINVQTTTTEGHKTFTLSTSGVASETNLNALSSATVHNFQNMTNILSALTDVVVTGISGDTIIVAEPVGNGTGSNSYNLTHKTAPNAVAAGFNKLATDVYGHVTASTAVEAADIEGLGFKNSAWTEEKIASAITALDVTDAAVAGQYVSSVNETDGKISVSRADVSKAPLNDYAKGSDATAVAATDTVNQAISKLENQIANAKAAATTKVEKDANANHLTLASSTAADGSVTYTIGEDNIASKTDLDALSGAVESFTAATDAKFTALSAYTEDVDNKVKALSAGTIQLSADTVAYVNAVSGNIESVILAMDKDASAVAGKVVTTVAQEDGKVTETKANVKDLQLGGYSKDAAATGAIAGTDTINTALSKLENQVGANKITNADGSIAVTEPAGTATTTDVKVNIKSGEKVIKLAGEGGGLYTNLNLVKITESLPATVKERYEFRDSDNNKIGESIDIAKDSHIVSITYDETTQKLIYTYLDASGATQTAEVDMAHLILETEVENGIQSVNGKLSIKLDTTGDDTGDGKFLTVGADGLKLDGVTDAINAAITGLSYADTAVAGQYVTEVDETNGVISVERANVSDAVLNGYAKGEKPASTAIAATDDVKGAIAKLEHQIDDAKAAATTKVVEGTDEGNNMTIVSTTSADNSVTYTVNLTDVASKAALDAEIAARKAVDGQNGDTYAANANTNFISNATSLNDADVKLDAAIKALSGDTDAAIKALDSVGSASTTGHYLTSVTITDGKISAVGEEALPAAVAITATTATPVNTPSAVLTGVTANGTDNHNLTFGMSNMVFSAKTSESADTAAALTGNITSGQVSDIVAGIENTKVHEAESADTADSAEKVAHALSVSGYSTSSASSLDSAFAFDGSEAESLTFGTNGQAGLKSMSMTSAGVVDVEVIDCGEY